MTAKKLDELCDFISGFWTGKKPPYVNVGVLRNTNFHKSGNLDFSDIAQLEVESKQFSTRQLKFGDIVLEKSGGGPKQPVGRVCVFEKSEGLFSLSNFTSAIRVKDEKELDYKYLHYFLKHQYITGETEKIQTHSTGIRNLQLSLYKEFLVPLPPLPIQQKIVAKLDAIFAEIDKATAAAETNAKNAEALFQSYLTQVFERGDEGWKRIKLKDIAEYFNGLTYSPKNVNEDGTVVLRSSNVQSDKILLNDIVRVNSTIKEKLYVKNGDILMCSRNGSKRLVGKTATIGNLEERMTFGTFMMIIRSESNFFIEWFFKSDLFKRQISSGENTMINQITRYMLDEIVIPLPDITTQKSISSKISNLYNTSHLLKSSYIKKIDELSLYKQSILKQAFNGELVNE